MEQISYDTEDCVTIDDREMRIPGVAFQEAHHHSVGFKYAPELLRAEETPDGIWEFWREFPDKLCEREAETNPILTPDTIWQFLIVPAQEMCMKRKGVGKFEAISPMSHIKKSN